MIDTTRNRESIFGNGSTTTIPIRFPFRKATDLVVVETVLATGVSTVKTYGTHYSVIGTQNAQGFFPSGGSVVMNTAPPSTVSITVYRDPVTIQPIDVTQTGKLQVESWIESPLDLLTMIAIRNRELISRSLRQSDGDAVDMGPLPVKSVRAGKFLGFDGLGNPVIPAQPGSALTPLAQITSYLKADLPPAGSIGALAYVLDDSRGLWVDTGTAWVPTNGTVINALDYLKGDGTDEHSAFQAMLDTGLSIHFPAPPVAYAFDGVLSLVTSGQTLFGDGPRSILRPLAANVNVFTTGAALTGIGISNLKVEGAAVNDTTAQYLLFSTPTYYVRRSLFSNVHVTGTNNGFLFDTGSDDNTVLACEFRELKGATSGRGYGVQMGSALRNHVINNRFFGSAGNGRHAVYVGSGTSYCLIAGNYISGFQQDCIAVYALAAQSACEHNLIVGNIIDGGVSSASESAAISVAGKCDHNIVAGNQITRFEKIGVLISDSGQGGLCQENTVRGNDISLCDRFGILLLGTKRTAVVGNVVMDNSQESAGTYDAINVRSSGSFGTEEDVDASIVGNVVRGASHRCALGLDSTAPQPSGVNYRGNDFRAGATGLISYYGVLLSGDDISYAASAAAASTPITAYGRLKTVVSLTVNISDPFTIEAPALAETSKELEIIVRNMTGGALGTITWNGVYKRSSWTSPASGKSRSIRFVYNGTNWIEVGKGAADVDT